MNRYGSMDLVARAADGLALDALATEALELKGVRILDCRTEIAAGPADALVPPALHPGIPAYGGWVVMQADDSPFGPFALAQLRIGVRIDAVGAFFAVGAVCDCEPLRRALAEGWGWRVGEGQARIEELYHRVDATVTTGGRTVLGLTLTERRPLPGTRLSTPSLVSLARFRGRSTLINAAVTSNNIGADGGRYALTAFDGAAFGANDAFRPSFPMGATYGVADLTLGAPDFIMDADRPAEETLREAAA